MTINQDLMRMSLAGGITVALLVGMGVAATAQTPTVIGERLPDDIPIEKVYFGDLNLASAAGEQRLVTRVRGAVRRVCAPQTEAILYHGCRSFAWKDAEPQIDRAVARARAMASNGQWLPPVAIVISAAR